MNNFCMMKNVLTDMKVSVPDNFSALTHKQKYTLFLLPNLKQKVFPYLRGKIPNASASANSYKTVNESIFINGNAHQQDNWIFSAIMLR
jgi:hypothetical protein